jgi:hypothetical protein
MLRFFSVYRRIIPTTLKHFIVLCIPHIFGKTTLMITGKASIILKSDVLLISGRSRLFVLPTSQAYKIQHNVENYNLKSSIKLELSRSRE